MSTSNCAGFWAHSLNSNRCRRCFCDRSEHVDNGSKRTNPQQPSRVTNNENVDDGDGGGGGNSKTTSASFTLKPNKRVTFSDVDKSSSNETNNDVEPNVEFTVCVKKPPSKVTHRTSPTIAVSSAPVIDVPGTENYYPSRINELAQELSKSKEKIDCLETKNRELETMCKNYTKTERREAIKQNFDENSKLKQRIDELEKELNNSQNNLKQSGMIVELETKLKKSEALVFKLKSENEDIRKDVQSLEAEFQELHDNFHEDQSSDQFRVLKREIESTSKNCRVLQFKLRKAERTIELMDNEKMELQKRFNDMYETTRMDVDKRRMRELENELKIAKEVSLKLHDEIEVLKEERMMAIEQVQELQRKQDISNSNKNDKPLLIGKLSPTPSFDQSKEYEQIVRDLYDTIEREKDISEQLKFSEEESRTMRKKLSTLEQENEILMMQIRKMTAKKSNKLANNLNQDNNDDEDDTEHDLNTEEMKLHLDLYEQEMIVLRRKTDELEQENENFQQEIKYLQEKLISQPMAKIEMPELPSNASTNVIYDHKIRMIEIEARELRKKLIDKEKENENLRTEVDLHRRRQSKVINRSRSLDANSESLDIKKQLQLFEQEANILRQKNITLEAENERLTSENKRMQIRINKKPPLSSIDQLQVENIELKQKCSDLERKLDSFKNELMNAKLGPITSNETDFIANLKRQLKARDEDVDKLKTKSSQIEVELSKVNREYKRLKEASLNIRRKPMRIIRETATRGELKEIIKELESEIVDVQTNVREKEALVENLEEEMNEIKQENQSLKVQYNDDEIVNVLKNRLQDEQNRCKTLEMKLSRISGGGDIEKYLEKLEILQSEKKESEIKIEQLQSELNRVETKFKDLEEKMKIKQENINELEANNTKLKETIDQSNSEVNTLRKRLKRSNKLEQKSINTDEDYGVNNSELNEIKQQLLQSNEIIETLQKQLESKQSKVRDEFNEKIEQTTKMVRHEVHRELQNLREECTINKNRCNELLIQLEQNERELKESNDKFKLLQGQLRKEREEKNELKRELEHQLKMEQRKREKLEKELDSISRVKEDELLLIQGKLVQSERERRRLQTKLDDNEYSYNGKVNTIERELNKVKQEYSELNTRYDLIGKDYNELRTKSQNEKETLVEALKTLKKSYEDKISELKHMKETLVSQQKEWYKDKLNYQERIALHESKLNRANMIENEHNRLKVLINEKENLLNSYRKEERNHNEERERNRIKVEELNNKVSELERIERNTRFMNITGRVQVDKELQNYRIRLEHSETSHKGELAALHAEYEGRMRLMGEEIEHMQQQISLIVQERDRYRNQIELLNEKQNEVKMQPNWKNEIDDLQTQLRTIRSELEGSLLENRNLRIQHGTERTSWQIQMADYRTQLNQMEERILLETRGNTRNYARTKMELAWEKERQENQRILQETQKFIQELRDKVIALESLREKERDESRKQLNELKSGVDREHGQTQEIIAELQLDLIALKEAHTRIKSQNERLRNERATYVKIKVDFVQDEIEQLQRLIEPKSNDSSLVENVQRLQTRLKGKYEQLIRDLNNINITGSNLSIVSQNSISSNLPLPSTIKRAPPRAKLKKSISLDQQLTTRGISQERIWDSDRSLESTPNSSITNLRISGTNRFGSVGGGYESDSSIGSTSLFSAPGLLRLRTGFIREGSTSTTGGDNESQTSNVNTLWKSRKSSKEKESKKEDEMKHKLALDGFEMSPLEQRQKKEKSLRYRISKTLSKTFSRSASQLNEDQKKSDATATNKVKARTKSPTRNTVQVDKHKTNEQQTPGLAQLRARPTYSNLAIPPSKQSPPSKVRIPTETNV